MSKITTHVLDVVLGKPAAGVSVQLERMNGADGWYQRGGPGEDALWVGVGACATDADGRCTNLKSDAADGFYRLTFNTGAYLKQFGRTGIYPEISITFQCDGASHYHLPLLLSDNGYTTYRGS